MQDITIKQVLNPEGTIEHLELWQGSQHIKVSLGNTDLDNKKRLYKWNNLVRVVETIKENL